MIPKNHGEEIAEEIKKDVPEDRDGKDLSFAAFIIGGSIVLAGLIIAGSVLYGTRSMLKYFDQFPQKLLQNAGQALGNAAGNQQAQGGQQTQPPSQPTGPVSVALRSNEPTLGNSGAKVTVIEFGDFQCPYCQSFFTTTLPQIKSQYIDTGKIKYIFREFPLPFHGNAQIAAQAAECANLQGKFWQYHDILYKNSQGDGTNLDKASLEKYASGLGLNSGFLGIGSNKFNKCLESSSTLDTVKGDVAEGTKDGVSGTPSFFINGQLLVGAQPFAQFQQAIDAALKK